MTHRRLAFACAIAGLLALAILYGDYAAAPATGTDLGFGFGRSSTAIAGTGSDGFDPRATATGRTQANALTDNSDRAGQPQPPPTPLVERQQSPTAAGLALSAGFGAGMERMTVSDINGFGQPIPALSLEVPAGWHGEGGVSWAVQSNCSQAVPELSWRASSPDGSQVFEILPMSVWQSIGTAMQPILPGCPVLDISSARAYLEALIQHRRPHGRMLDYRAREDLAMQVALPPEVPTLDGSLQIRNRAEAGEILVAWSEGGREMRESIAVSMMFQEMRFSILPGQVQQALIGIANPAVALRAPDGQLDLDLSSRILASIQPAPDWQARMQAHQQRMNQIANEGAANRSRITAASNAEISRIQNEGWHARQQIQDDGHRRFLDAIRGTQPFHDSLTGQQHDLSNQYQHAWQLNDGSHVQSDDPDFNPYYDLGVDGRQLDPVR